MAGITMDRRWRPRSQSLLLSLALLLSLLLIAAPRSLSFAAGRSWQAAAQVRTGAGQSTARQALPSAQALPGVQEALDAGLLLSADADAPTMFAGAAALVAALAALAFAATRTEERPDGAREKDLPPWADMVSVMGDALSGKPFDDVLLSMRARHGDAFRIFVPAIFGETMVLMGREANQFVFTEQDKNLDQALGAVVGTAVAGKKTMGTKERKETESGRIFDKASANFFSNKLALKRATQIFVDSAQDFCDQMEKECKPDQNVFELLWTYVVQTNADMLYGNGENAGSIVCRTIDSINKEGLFSPQVRKAGEDLRSVLVRRYDDRATNPEKYEGEDSMFEEFYTLSKGKADPDMLAGFQQFMLTLQLAANGNQLVTIRWLMSHVYADKALLEGVRAEVRAKLAEKGEGTTIRQLTLEDLLDLRLTNACITEAVRLHSDIPSKLTFRQAEIDMEFKGFKIPKGSTIFLYADAVHKDEKYFPDAGGFCPHRYTDPESFNKMQMDREIVTFGHGRKRCTGELHARAQISALLASFVMRFDLDLSTNEPGNQIPEDHDGPFVFDTANSVCLVNLRRAAESSGSGATAKFEVPVTAAAAFLGQRMPSEEEAAGESGGKCPFGSLFGGR
uniref:Cytochrome P450 n=1 Tax=Alexandrium monilatum TaxID=311494 RepID=A0A6T1B657_9DINO